MTVSKRRVPLLTLAVAALLLSSLVFSFFVFGSHTAQASGGSGFNAPGNILISDQFNNRVIEVNRDKQIVWSFGSGDPSKCNPGPGAIIGLNDAERIGDGLTILAGTGIPAGVSSFLPNGCVDNRVIVVDQDGNIVWQFGTAGSTTGPLNVPVFAIQLPNHNFLIVDQGNNRVIEVSKSTKTIVWSSSDHGVTLNNPNSAELLPNGHVLIADENNNRAIEITRAGKIVWQTAASLNLSGVAFASRLPNGNTLITDSNNSRILEVTPDQRIVFQYFTNKVKNSNPKGDFPTNAVQLADGDISIADQFNNRALIIDPDKSNEFQYGMTNVIGNGHNQLDGPYTAFAIGDYTGQTPPPEHF